MSKKIFIEKYTVSHVNVQETPDEESSSISLVFDLKQNRWQRPLSSVSSATSDYTVEPCTTEVRLIKNNKMFISRPKSVKL